MASRETEARVPGFFFPVDALFDVSDPSPIAARSAVASPASTSRRAQARDNGTFGSSSRPPNPSPTLLSGYAPPPPACAAPASRTRLRCPSPRWLARALEERGGFRVGLRGGLAIAARGGRSGRLRSVGRGARGRETPTGRARPRGRGAQGRERGGDERRHRGGSAGSGEREQPAKVPGKYRCAALSLSKTSHASRKCCDVMT